MKAIFEKYKDVIPYAVFGVLTTLLNIAAYWLFAHPLSLGVMASTILAWILSVLFAYGTNRKWVFHSEARGVPAVMKEMLSFFACRLLTGAFDWLSMLVFAELLRWNDMIVKIVVNGIVIVLNYVASKLIIFKKQR